VPRAREKVIFTSSSTWCVQGRHPIGKPKGGTPTNSNPHPPPLARINSRDTTACWILYSKAQMLGSTTTCKNSCCSSRLYMRLLLIHLWSLAKLGYILLQDNLDETVWSRSFSVEILLRVFYLCHIIKYRNKNINKTTFLVDSFISQFSTLVTAFNCYKIY
jgi:hypothetical protein